MIDECIYTTENQRFDEHLTPTIVVERAKEGFVIDPNLIFAHRGFWHTRSEQNSKIAIDRAKLLNVSVEVDIRTLADQIVISHDLNDSISTQFPDLEFFSKNRVAINIKEDGLQDKLHNYVSNMRANNSFIFDASIPEMVKYYEKDFPTALRLSEFEQEIPWKTTNIWLDSFYSDWWIKKDIIQKFSDNYNLIVVSPELHHRDHKQAWDVVLNHLQKGNPNLGICTDYPLDFLRQANG